MSEIPKSVPGADPRTPHAAPWTDMVVIDTDTYNEVDDQFAVVYALLSGERITLKAIHAAPFHNARSTGPGNGMERSYQEIIRLLKRLGVKERDRVLRSADRFLPGRTEAVDSDAARHLIELSRSSSEPLIVTAIGAITNVASALLLNPEIVKRIVVMWLGGQPLHSPSAREFNLQGDIPAAQVMLDSGVPLVQLPSRGVTSHLLTTIPEIAQYVRPHGDSGRYLFETYESYRKDQFARSKQIWDIGVTGFLLEPLWVPPNVVASPILTDQVTWSIDPARHPIRIATMVDRDAIFGDLFSKLKKLAAGDLQPSWA